MESKLQLAIEALKFYAAQESYASYPRGPDVMKDQGQKAREALALADVPSPQDSLCHPAHRVYFRAGLIACREYMARFVEAQDPAIAASIRANWWPQLGEDFGPPRQLAFGELTEGEFDTPSFRCKDASEISPTLEALPVALGFLESCKPEVKEPQR